MTGTRDPMMNFPKTLVFSPYGHLRNVGTQPQTVTFGMNYTDSKDAPHSLPVRNVTLQPGQSSQLALEETCLKLALV